MDIKSEIIKNLEKICEKEFIGEVKQTSLKKIEAKNYQLFKKRMEQIFRIQLSKHIDKDLINYNMADCIRDCRFYNITMFHQKYIIIIYKKCMIRYHIDSKSYHVHELINQYCTGCGNIIKENYGGYVSKEVTDDYAINDYCTECYYHDVIPMYR